MFNNDLVLSHLKELITWFEAAEDPNGDFPCFGSSELSRLGVGHILRFLLWRPNWSKDALIEGFDSDPRDATGTDALSPCNADYFQLRNEDGKTDGKRVLLVNYSRPIGYLNGIYETRATYIIEYKDDKWQITHAYIGV